jgi:hypothetical protein
VVGTEIVITNHEMLKQGYIYGTYFEGVSKLLSMQARTQKNGSSYLWIDTLFLGGAILVDHKLDSVRTTVNTPEDGLVPTVVHIVWIGSSSQ